MWPVYEAELERHLGASLSDEEADTIRVALLRAAQSACTLDDERPQPFEEPVAST